MSQDILVAGAAGIVGAWVLLKLWVGRPLPTKTERECDAYKVVGYRNALGNVLHDKGGGKLSTAPVASEVYDGLRKEYKRVVNSPLPNQVIPNGNPWPQI